MAHCMSDSILPASILQAAQDNRSSFKRCSTTAHIAAHRALLVRHGKRFRDHTDMSHASRAAEERRILERWRGDP